MRLALRNQPDLRRKYRRHVHAKLLPAAHTYCTSYYSRATRLALQTSKIVDCPLIANAKMSFKRQDDRLFWIMHRLVPISGLIKKAPACFLIETKSCRLLLDFGEGPPPGRVPDLKGIGKVDALLFSHQHADHMGAIEHLEKIGSPRIYASEIVARSLPSDLSVSYLPINGATNILGIPVQVGRSGHAPGGVWMHFDIGDGLIYMGDNCTSSLIYAHDTPPMAGTLILDCSYAIDDKSLSIGQKTLLELAANGPLLLPSVPQGRGPEMALHFFRSGLMPHLDDTLRAAIIGMRAECLLPEARYDLAKLAQAPTIPDKPSGVMIATPGNADKGQSKLLVEKWASDARVQIVFTGFVDPSLPSAQLVNEGRAKVVRWKIHPSLSENAELVRTTGAKTVLPCFGGGAANQADWQKAFAPARVVVEPAAIEI